MLGVSQEQFSEVLDAMFELLVKPQQHIIDQGDDGDNFYIIEKLVSHLFTFAVLCPKNINRVTFWWNSFILTLLSVRHATSRGVYDIFVQKDGVDVCVGKYDNKGSFGELALMYNTPRAATIVATEEGALWALVSVDDGASPSLGKGVVNMSGLCASLSPSLSGSSHIPPPDCQKQCKEKEDVRDLHRERLSAEISGGSLRLGTLRTLGLVHLPVHFLWRPTFSLAFVFLDKLSERMKIVDVLGARAFKDGERIITQVG